MNHFSNSKKVFQVLTMGFALGMLPALPPVITPDRADIAPQDFDIAPLAQLFEADQAYAATTNPTTASPGYSTQTISYQGQLSTTTANKSTWKAPWPLRLVDIKCSARLLDTTTGNETYTFTLQAGAVTVATCVPAAAATEVSGTIAAPSVADEANLTIDYAGGGTTPLADDVTIILIWKRQ